ncbi:hypothetical protein B0T25DRAFT_443078, partial [Lasiosphaeria hispida]
YYDQFSLVKAASGDFIALQYQENGHITLPTINPNKTPNYRTVNVYGTLHNNLIDTNLIDIHLTWTPDGTGSNQKGRLITTQDYDNR